MNGPDVNPISITELSLNLGGGNWTLYQAQQNEENHQELKLLFENLPGILIVDFFQNNVINKMDDRRSSEGWIDLWATGLDDVTWQYRLCPVPD